MSDDSNETGDFVIFVGQAPIATDAAYQQRVNDVLRLLSGREISEFFLLSAEDKIFQLWLVFADGSTYEFGSLSPIEVPTGPDGDPLERLLGQTLLSFQVNRLGEGRSELVLQVSGGMVCRFSTAGLFHLDAEDRRDEMALMLWLEMGSTLLLHAGGEREEWKEATNDYDE